MISINTEKCKACGLCVKNCPLGAAELDRKILRINENCVSCGVCVRICDFEALEKNTELAAGSLTCEACPINCIIPPNKNGACLRFFNDGKSIVRNRKLVIETVCNSVEQKLLLRPLITAVGSGTRYPCFKPAPHIIQETVDGVDVVTVVTEAPLSYSGAKVKIDANRYIGEEGAMVKREGKTVGMVTTEEYGSKMLTLGGANLLSGSNAGFVVARTIVDLVNGRKVTLRVEGGAKLEVQQGKPPVIDGLEEKYMRIGCGSATIGMLAEIFAQVVDEVIILDYHVIGLLTEHAAGRELGLKYSGIVPRGRKSTNGRYFGTQGYGWGGTNITDPESAVEHVDMEDAWPGLRLLITETTGQKAALFQVTAKGTLQEVPLTEGVQQAVKVIADNCESSLVSVIYTGGTGGSARAGVTRFPLKLTRAVHSEEVALTIAGAPAFILPGGGINFMVDVSRMVPDSLTWVPTPATVAPVEYTMTRKTFDKLGGHKEVIKTKKKLLKELGLEK